MDLTGCCVSFLFFLFRRGEYVLLARSARCGRLTCHCWLRHRHLLARKELVRFYVREAIPGCAFD